MLTIKGSRIAAACVCLSAVMVCQTLQAQPDAGSPKAADAGARGAADAGRAPDPLAVKLRPVSRLMRGKKMREAEVIVAEVLKADPDYEVALLYMSDILDQTGRESEAVEMLKKATASPKCVPRIYIQLASMHERLKDRAQSLKVLDDCVARYKKDVACYVRRGQFFGVGNMEKAAANYKQALALDPDNRTALNNLASIHMAFCRFKEANVLLERYHKAHPNSSSGAFNLGTTYYALGSVDKGISIHEILLERRPNHAIALSGLALGHILAGDTDKGLKTLAAVSGAPKPSPPVAYAVGMAHLFAGDATAAEVELSKAVSAAPRRTHFVIALAEANRQLGKLKEAEEALNRHKKVSQTAVPYVGIYQALLLHTQGKEDLARSEMKKATERLADFTRPEDLRYLMRVPPKGVELAKTLLSASGDDKTTSDKADKKPEEAKGGCGCAVPGSPIDGGLPWLAALALIFGLRASKKHTRR